MKTIACFLLIIFTLSSCHTVRKTSADASLYAITKSNFNLLQGTWKNIPIDNKLNKSNASTFDVNVLQDVQLLKQFFLLADDGIADADRIQLLPINNQLQITAFKENEVVTKFSIKGKFKKGYFKTRKESKTEFPPILPFYYFNENVRLYITIDKDQNLVIKRRGKKTGMLFFFASGFSMDNEYRYAPIAPKHNLTDSVTKDMSDTTSFVNPEDAIFIPPPSGEPSVDKKLNEVLDKVKRINAFHDWDNVMWTDIETSGEGGKAGFHITNDEVWVINKVEYGETFRTEKDYYFDEKSGELIYMEERQYRYNRPIYYDAKVAKENNDTEAFDESKSVVTTWYHYFENGKLFYRINKNGEPEDKTLWERLGREILNELSEIYKKKL